MFFQDYSKDEPPKPQQEPGGHKGTTGSREAIGSRKASASSTQPGGTPAGPGGIKDTKPAMPNANRNPAFGTFLGCGRWGEARPLRLRLSPMDTCTPCPPITFLAPMTLPLLDPESLKDLSPPMS